MCLDSFLVFLCIACWIYLPLRHASQNYGSPCDDYQRFNKADMEDVTPACLSCTDRCGSVSNYTLGITCSCDSNCVVYNDCCPNFTKVCKKERDNSRWRKRKSSVCTKTSEKLNFEYEYMLINSCENQICAVQDAENLEEIIPVYDVYTGLHYINYKCAKCNGVRNIIPWKSVITCSERKNLAAMEQLILELYQNQGNLTWKSALNNFKCKLNTFFKPKVMDTPRLCPEEFIDTCRLRCNNSFLEDSCRNSPRNYVSYHFVKRSYANTACAICDNIFLFQPLKCQLHIRPKHLVFPDLSAFSFHILFDADNSYKLVVDRESPVKLNPCSNDKTWDTVKQKCAPSVVSVKAFKIGTTQELYVLLNITGVEIVPFLWPYIRDGLSEYILPRIDGFKSIEVVQNDTKSLILRITAKNMSSEEMNKLDVLANYYFNVISPGSESELIIYPTNVTRSSCKWIVYNRNEFQFGENSTIRTLLDGKQIGAADYYIRNFTAFVCKQEDFSFGILTIICLSISIICLLVCLFLHFKFPAKDRVSVHLQICLASAMLTAKLCFLFRPFLVDNKIACYVIAVMVHWSFLAVFSWMTMVAFDIFLLFRASAHFKRLSSRHISFVTYSIIAWLLPTIITGVAIVTDLKTTHWTNPMYGGALCWLSNKYGLLLYFSTPAAFAFLINIIIYILTVIQMYCVNNSSAQESTKVSKYRFLIHIKLSILMGITWVIGIYATLRKSKAAWVVFIILNAPKGLFLLLVALSAKNVSKHLCKAKKTSADQGTTKATRTTRLSK